MPCHFDFGKFKQFTIHQRLKETRVYCLHLQVEVQEETQGEVGFNLVELVSTSEPPCYVLVKKVIGFSDSKLDCIVPKPALHPKGFMQPAIC